MHVHSRRYDATINPVPEIYKISNTLEYTKECNRACW